MPDADTLYHRLFSHPLMVEQLVRDFVPDAVAVGLDFARMERVSAKFHGHRVGTRRDGDVIWRLPTQTGPDVYLYLLLEFQSTPDWWMAVRAQVYEGLLWQHVIAEHRLSPGDPLPPVFLMVLYNGARPWTAPTDTTGLIGLPEGSPLWPWQPRIRYHLLDMGRMPEDALTGRDSLTSLLVQLERPHELEALKQVIDAVVGWFRTHPDYADLRRLFTELIGQAMAGGGLPGPVPRDLMEMRTMLEILIEESKRKWRAEALAEGKAEGKAEGETKGRSEGQRQMLMRLLEHRFGPLSDDRCARILSVDEATLATWEKRLFDAQSIDDILAPPH